MWLVGRGGGGGGGEGGEEGGGDSASPCACGTNGCTRGNIFHISCQSKDTAVRGQKVNKKFEHSIPPKFKGQKVNKVQKSANNFTDTHVKAVYYKVRMEN